jgi:hypothetical protein
MIEWMKTLPQDAEVHCGVEVRGGGYECWMDLNPSMDYRAVDIEDCYVLDYTSEEDRAKYPTMAGKALVVIRGE